MEHTFTADEDFGLILESALRYSLGRRTYMPGLTRRYIRRYEGCLTANRLACMKRDVDTFICDRSTDSSEWQEFSDHLGEALRTAQKEKEA